MDGQARITLEEIGLSLDYDKYPSIHNGGYVRPREAPIDQNKQGKDTKHHELQTRNRKKPTQSRKARRSGASPRSTQVFSSSLQKNYAENLSAVLEAYPDTRVWHREDGIWLLSESAILTGLDKSAMFLIAVPFTPEFPIRAWAWWTTKVSVQWIGPRHTNYPDGSICAFEPSDQTWNPGDSLVNLLDLYTLWALRHLHLEVFGRWPGRQVLHHAYERIQEAQDNELCGCNNPKGTYANCCKSSDLELNKVTLHDDFFKTRPLTPRRPPAELFRFSRTRNQPPSIFGAVLS